MVSKAASETLTEAAPPPAAGGKYLDSNVSGAAKILVVGPLGVGKTTLIGTVSEIRPLSTEASMTRAPGTAARRPPRSASTSAG